MFNYLETLTQLQKLMKQVESDNSLQCISIYLPFNKNSQNSTAWEVVDTHFKSLVETEVQKFLTLHSQKELRMAIISKIAQVSGSFDNTYKGVSVYATFFTGTEFKGGHNKNVSLELVPFIQAVPLFILPTPKSSAFIGKVFDLIPILSNLNQDNPTLVVDIHQDEALLYEFAQMQLKLLIHVENSYTKFPEREEYLDQTQPNNSNRKDFNYTEDYLLKFLQDDLTKAVSLYSKLYKIMLIVCPEEYEPQISRFAGQQNNHFAKVETMHLSTNKTSELLYQHLSQRAETQIEKAKLLTKQQLANPSKKFNNNLETNLQKILEAAEVGQVDTLYVVPNYHTPGFVTDEEDNLIQKTNIITGTNEEFLKTNQVVMYIIQKVNQLGGKVIPISKDILPNLLPSILPNKLITVSALFRY